MSNLLQILGQILLSIGVLSLALEVSRLSERVRKLERPWGRGV